MSTSQPWTIRIARRSGFRRRLGRGSYPTIRRSIAEQPAVLDFLHQIGLTEPDVVDEVLTSIVPRYEVEEPDDTDYAADLERIALALRTATGNKRMKLRDVLEETAFLVGRNAANGEEVWSMPLRALRAHRDRNDVSRGQPRRVVPGGRMRPLRRLLARGRASRRDLDRSTQA